MGVGVATGGVGVGFGFVSEVLQPANSAKDNIVAAMEITLILRENISPFVTHARATNKSAESPSRNYLHNLQPISRLKLAMGKFRGRHRIAVVLHDHTARQKILRDEKFLNRTRKFCFDWLSVGDDGRIHGISSLFVRLSKIISSESPNARLSPAEMMLNLFVEMKVNL